MAHVVGGATVMPENAPCDGQNNGAYERICNGHWHANRVHCITPAPPTSENKRVRAREAFAVQR